MAIAPADDPVLRLDDLSVSFRATEGRFQAVQNVSLAVSRGQILGVVGESGCGKTATFMAALSQLPKSAQVTGEAWFDGRNLLTMPRRERRRTLGKEIGIIFQEPTATLDPLFPVGRQLGEVLTQHGHFEAGPLRERKLELFRDTGITDPERRLRQYPFQLSGGLCQRIGIAMAFGHNPELIVADEPTTALDVTVQAQILRLLLNLVRTQGSALVLISHDLGVIAQLADRVVVMYGGMVVEAAPVEQIFGNPQHPYTQRLLESIPQPDQATSRLTSIPGMVPSRYDQLAGCRFAPRCTLAHAECLSAVPPLLDVGPAHEARCVLVAEHSAGSHPREVPGATGG